MFKDRPSDGMARRWLLAICLLAIAVVLVFALPITAWRTGRQNALQFDLVSGGPSVPQSSRIWIDTDAACGATPTTDPDDCLAIAWLAQNGHAIAGISTSYGNANGDVVLRTTRMLVSKIVESGQTLIKVWRGWDSPVVKADNGVPPAQAALRTALNEGPLTILALGPLTNIADALEDRPELQHNVTRLVAVMGHQPGHLFHPAEASGRGILMGHGPIFRDLNFSMDETAAQSILDMHLPLTLIPYDAAVHTIITSADIEKLAHQGPTLSWAAATTKGWLNFWQNDIGQPGFYPFDWVAAAYFAKPSLFNCAPTHVQIEREWVFWVYPRWSFLVSPIADGQHEASLYCPQPASSLHDFLLNGIAR